MPCTRLHGLALHAGPFKLQDGHVGLRRRGQRGNVKHHAPEQPAQVAQHLGAEAVPNIAGSWGVSLKSGEQSMEATARARKKHNYRL